MLDVDHGTYPFVTSSNTVAAAAALGLRHRPGQRRLRAGHLQGLHHPRRLGPVPDRAGDEIGRGLGERGHEFGTVTGRPRRCGWFDAVLVRQAVKLGGIQGLALTKLDVLDGMASAEGLHRLHAGRPDPAPSAGRHGRPGGGQAGLRGAGGLAGEHPRRPQLRPAARPTRSSTSSAWRSWSSARWRCSRPAPTATTRSWCGTRSPTERRGIAMTPDPRDRRGRWAAAGAGAGVGVDADRRLTARARRTCTSATRCGWPRWRGRGPPPSRCCSRSKSVAQGDARDRAPAAGLCGRSRAAGR